MSLLFLLKNYFLRLTLSQVLDAWIIIDRVIAATMLNFKNSE